MIKGQAPKLVEEVSGVPGVQWNPGYVRLQKVIHKEGDTFCRGIIRCYNGSTSMARLVEFWQEIQWNLRIKDTLGGKFLSPVQRLSFGGRLDQVCNL